MSKFSIKEAIAFGWRTLKENFWFFVSVLVAAWLLTAIPTFVSNLFSDQMVLAAVVSLAGWVLTVIVQMGLINISIKFVDNFKAEFADLFRPYPMFFNYFVGSILYGLIVFGGTILLIVPGIIWAIMFQFYSYYIVDKKAGPIEALKKSAAITYGAKWDLFLFGLLVVAINLAGAIALGIGLFVTIPTTMVAMAFVYRKLLSVSQS